MIWTVVDTESSHEKAVIGPMTKELTIFLRLEDNYPINTLIIMFYNEIGYLTLWIGVDDVPIPIVGGW